MNVGIVFEKCNSSLGKVLMKQKLCTLRAPMKNIFPKLVNCNLEIFIIKNKRGKGFIMYYVKYILFIGPDK